MDETRTIAVIGADSALRRGVCEALRALGHDVLAVANPDAMETQARTRDVRLVVMVGLERFSAIRQLQQKGGGGVPVAVAVDCGLDDCALGHALRQAEGDGAQDAWVFPLRPAELEVRVRKLLRGSAETACGVVAGGYAACCADAADAAIMFDAATGAIVHANASAETFFGATDRKLAGRAFEDLPPAPLRDFARVFFHEQLGLLRAGKTSRSEFYIANGEGREVLVELSMQLGMSGGRAVVLGFFRDMTEKAQADQRLRVSRENARAMIDAIRGDVVLLDMAGRLVAANKSWSTRMGTTPQEAVGQVFLSFFEDTSREMRKNKMREAFRTRRPVRFEEERNERVYDITYYPVMGDGGEVRQIVGYSHDMTEYVKAQQTLQEHLRFIQTLMNATPSPIFFKDFSGKYLECNKAFEDLLGLRREVILGSSAEDVAPADLARQYAAMDRKMQEGELRQIYEAKVRTGSGELRDVIFNKATYSNYFGQPVGIVGVVTDVTERKRTERDLAKSEKMFRMLFEAAGDAIMIMRDDVVADCNPAAMAFFGKNRASLVGSVPQALCPGMDTEGCGDVGGFQGRINAAMHGKAQHFEWGCRRWDGTLCDVEVSLNKVALGGESYVQALVRDATVRKQAERAMEAARREAEAATRAKSIFLATMSHEIRTPLNVILGMTQQALRGSDPAHMRRMLESVHSAGGALLCIINDILDLSKVEAGKLDLERIDFDLHELLMEGSAMYSFQASKRGLTLDVTIGEDVPRYVKGDPARLRQVLGNLVSNAIKFTSSGGIRVTVLSEAAAGKTGQGNDAEGGVLLRISVQDTGMGIMPDKLETVFESFSQADGSVSREYGGTGLGLAISKRLVEMMGGGIKVDSKPGEGSVFTFTVLAGMGKAPALTTIAAEAAISADTEAMRPLRVLVVEDNALNRELACRFLESEGNTVLEAVNGRHALEMLEVNPVDVVLMDIQMPEMDGMSTTRAIRASTHLAVPGDVPVVAMTAHALKGDKERFLEAGMTEYVAKPIDFVKLLRLLAHVVRKAETPPGASRQASLREGGPATGEAGVPDGAPGGRAAPDADDTPPHQDREASLALLGGNKVLLRHLESVFMREVAKDFGSLEEALETGDMAVASRLAHSLKGSASTIGAMRLSVWALEMEHALRGEDAVASRKLFAALAAELELVKDLLMEQGVRAHNA